MYAHYEMRADTCYRYSLLCASLADLLIFAGSRCWRFGSHNYQSVLRSFCSCFIGIYVSCCCPLTTHTLWQTLAVVICHTIHNVRLLSNVHTQSNKTNRQILQHYQTVALFRNF